MSRVMRFLGANGSAPYVGQPAGVAAIWDAGAAGLDNSGLLDPRNNLGKIWLHSDLDYLRIVRTVKSTDPGMAPIAIPATPNNAPLNAEFPLFAHGLLATPLFNADIEIDAYRQPAAGSIMPVPGGIAPASFNSNPTSGFRWLGFTSDATTIYLHARGFVAPAMTVHWTVRLYEETFQSVSGPATLLFLSPTSATLAALGKVGADRRFVRLASGAGQFRVLGQRTMQMIEQSNFPVVHMSDGVLDLRQQLFQNKGQIITGGLLHAAGWEAEITGGVPRGQGFTYDEQGIEIADGADVVFTTARAMEVGFGQRVGTLNLPAVASAAFGTTVDHDVGAAETGVALLRGFGRFANATDFLPANRNFDFSGSVLLQAGAQLESNGNNSVTAMRLVSPMIVAGRVVIREQQFAAFGQSLGAVTLDYDLRPAAFVGGI